MGWTGNHHKRTTRLRHRPVLEHLDERCLLSTGTGIHFTSHFDTQALDRRHTQVRLPHGRARGAERAVPELRHDAPKSNQLERPAGSIEVGAATAYDPVIGAAAARAAYNVDGTGMTVAVIDTGVDYNNVALGSGLGAGYKVIAGYDFADNTSNPMATSSQHGTAIAGLIGSDLPSDLGVAPAVKIVALRVTDDTNTASLNNVANALQWVIDNHAQYHITAVNMSLSDGGNYAQNWFAADGGTGQQVTSLIGQLTAMNIPVIAATGNSFNGIQGEGFAAIVAGTISVTATDLSGNLLPNAQRLGLAIGGASATTIAAPGEGLTAPSGDSGTSTVEGTSFAAALVTGGVTLLQEIYQSRFGALPTVAQIKTWLQEGSNLVNDPVTGITIGELNILQAASLIPGKSQAQKPAPPAAHPVVAPAPVNTSDSTPGMPAPVMTPVTTFVTTASNVQVFVNGQQIDASGTTLGAWAASDSGQSVPAATQVQIWNA
jgi:subtilisin family serine protease